ncbi:MAG: cysteine desulfurase [Puniceicoccaceae bacterium]|nr:cysteine desulfurase [Puniceicoccaceae bacterium]RCL36991.1 MAG: cysteine desulfurase [Puniceicoccaceae bacterium]
MELRYFDHNATTPLCEAAKAAWISASEAQWFNPSSPYRGAAAVKVRYEAARESLARHFGVSPERVIFTSGATESNNAVIRYWARSLSSDACVGINPTEHPSVIAVARALLGSRVVWLPLSKGGVVDMDTLRGRIESGTLAAVSVMAANNETGVIQPWQAIAKLCAKAQIPYHCDAAQWVGKLPVEGLSACAYVTACGHKFGGPKGVGFMLLPEGVVDFRLLDGGEQEAAHRAGTEDVAGVFAMSAALENSRPGKAEARDAFIEQIVQAIPGVALIGAGTDRLWNTVSMSMPRHQSVRWIRALEKAGFLLSAGSACSTGKTSVSEVLLAMGIDATTAGRILRISADAETTAEDWQALADALLVTYKLLNEEADSMKSQVVSID